MKAKILAAVALLLPLAACQTPLAPVQVTRFHVSVPPVGSSIAIVPAANADTGIEYRTYAAAVAQALQRAGYQASFNGEPAAYRAEVSYLVDIYRPGRRNSPVSVGVGGATGSYGSGMGLGVGINLSGPPKDVIETALNVRILQDAPRRQADAQPQVLWEGRALTSAMEGTPAAQPGIGAAKLADALFRDYPGRSGETITVK